MLFKTEETSSENLLFDGDICLDFKGGFVQKILDNTFYSLHKNEPMPNYYCKHCGRSTNDVYILTSGACSLSPTGRHQLYEGGEKKEYICKHCGRSFNDLYSLTHFSCQRSPTKRHEPALL